MLGVEQSAMLGVEAATVLLAHPLRWDFGFCKVGMVGRLWRLCPYCLLFSRLAEVRLRCVQKGLVVRPARCFFTPPLSNFLRDSFKPPRAEHDRTI